ncbi:hypothetical protein D9M71_149180 [compost metagenome]
MPDIDPLFVDTQRHDLTTLGLERNSRRDMPRIFHPETVLRIEQQHAQQVEGLLGAGHDDHLIGSAIDATGIEDVLGNRLAQGQQSLQFAITEHGLGRLVQVAVQQPLPDRLRECIVGAVAGQERGRAPGRPVGIGNAAKMIAAQRQHGLAQVGQARGLALVFIVFNTAAFPFMADIGPGPGPRRQKTFGNQLIERIENADSRQLQFLAQGPGGGQAHATLNPATEDLFANLQVELAVQGDGTGTVQLDT